MTKKKNSVLKSNWILGHMAGLFVFNLILLLLVMLYTAGYFHPFLPLTINLIVLLGLILSIFLLGMKSKEIFIFSLCFWLFAAFLRVMGVNIWAERSSIYAFEGFLVGSVVYIFEYLYSNEK